ncbi:transglutaminase-like cysteine peptidase [Bradyrhizobium sp. 159]|uniref:transglutaminase-like cysteine peptidase n=1 Tax=Bradyrhizobium sp. 159 TaxID=2782632 RepID=UPI00209794C8|nr:transglutaminase-like cysteine peptidase [Bradyrhizobium sp. 159]
MYCVCSQPAYSNYESQAVTPPLSFSQFCIQYPEDCQHHEDRRIRDFRSSIQRWRELAQINSTVNSGIAPKDPPASRRDAEWQIFPYEGNCALCGHQAPSTAAIRLAQLISPSRRGHHPINRRAPPRAACA